MTTRFEDKGSARRHVWNRMLEERVATFPLPPHGRIPNFKGAHQAAVRLFDLPVLANIRRMKVCPDSPQRPVRELALRRGIVIYVPTPRLRGGFRMLDPARIPQSRIREASTLSGGRRWSVVVPLAELPAMDLIVTGSVAVTREGLRCGKGEGYGDLEYAILKELGHPPVPVATTVHPLQIVERFPRDPNDLPISLIVIPEETIEVINPPTPPAGIQWNLITEEHLKTMPILRELKRMGRRGDKGPRGPR